MKRVIALALLAAACTDAPRDKEPSEPTARVSKGWQAPAEPFVPDYSDAQAQAERLLQERLQQGAGTRPNAVTVTVGGKSIALDAATLRSLTGADDGQGAGGRRGMGDGSGGGRQDEDDTEEGGGRDAGVPLTLVLERLAEGATFTTVQFVGKRGEVTQAAWAELKKHPEDFRVRLSRQDAFRFTLPEGLTVVQESRSPGQGPRGKRKKRAGSVLTEIRLL